MNDINCGFATTYTLLHSPIDLKLLNLNSAYSRHLGHLPLVHDKVVAYRRRSSTVKIYPRRPSCGQFGQDNGGFLRLQYSFICHTTFQRSPITRHRLSREKVNLHSTLVT